LSDLKQLKSGALFTRDYLPDAVRASAAYLTVGTDPLRTMLEATVRAYLHAAAGNQPDGEIAC
jgi:hypothetical protein